MRRLLLRAAVIATVGMQLAACKIEPVQYAAAPLPNPGCTAIRYKLAVRAPDADKSQGLIEAGAQSMVDPNDPLVRSLAGSYLTNAAAKDLTNIKKAEKPQDPVSPSMLLLSGGSQNGAFGAGFLDTWAEMRRDGGKGPGLPRFSVVTGISTGALQSTFAFLGQTDRAVAQYRIEREEQLLKPLSKGLNTVVDGGEQLTIRSGRDITLSGADASAANVLVEAGRDLTIESLQDTASRSSSSTGVNLGATLSGPQQQYGKPTLGGNVGLLVGSGSGQSAVVGDQTSLIARGGALEAHVGGTTTITGGVIAATDAAGQDSGQLTLDTSRLVVSDIADSAKSRDVSVGVSASINDPTRKSEDNGGNVPTLDGAYASSAFGQQTRGTIGQGTVAIADPGSGTPLGQVNRDLAEAQLVTKDETSGFTVYVDKGAIDELGALVSGNTQRSVILQGVETLTKDPLKPARDVVAEAKALADKVPDDSVVEQLMTSLTQLVNNQKIPEYKAAEIAGQQASGILASIAGDTPLTAEQRAAADEYRAAQAYLLMHPGDQAAKEQVGQAFEALLDATPDDPQQQAVVDDFLGMVSKASPVAGNGDIPVNGQRGYVVNSTMDNAGIYLGEKKREIEGAVGEFVAEHPGAGLLLNTAGAVGSIADPLGFATGLIYDQIKDHAAKEVGEVFYDSGWSEGKAAEGGEGTVFAVGVIAKGVTGLASVAGGIKTVTGSKAVNAAEKISLNVPGRVQSRINLMKGSQAEGAGWNHVVADHFNPAKSGKSQFSVSQSELRDILQSKDVVGSPVVRVLESARGPRYVREVTLDGRNIGIDVTTKSPTSTFTIMSDKYGNLITTFPGKVK